MVTIIPASLTATSAEGAWNTTERYDYCEDYLNGGFSREKQGFFTSLAKTISKLFA